MTIRASSRELSIVDLVNGMDGCGSTFEGWLTAALSAGAILLTVLRDGEVAASDVSDIVHGTIPSRCCSGSMPRLSRRRAFLPRARVLLERSEGAQTGMTFLLTSRSASRVRPLPRP